MALLTPELDHLRRLLVAENPADQRLALQVIAGQEVAELLRSELYLYALWIAKGPLVKEVRSILGEARLEVMRRYMEMGPGKGGVNSDPLIHLAKHPEVSAESLMRTLIVWQRPDFSPRFFYENASAEELKAVWPSPTHVVLRGLGLLEFPPAMRELKTIEVLHVPDNRIAALPDWLRELNNLKVLNVSGNPLSAIPSAFTDCFLLETLDLSATRVQTLGALQKLPFLRELHLKACTYLSRNALLQLPLGLEVLDLSKIPWPALPETLRSCDSLKELWLQGMPIEDWRAAASVLGSLSLKRLVVSEIQLGPAQDALERMAVELPPEIVYVDPFPREDD